MIVVDKLSQLNNLKGIKCLAYDLETTGLDPYQDNVLLIQLSDGKEIYVIIVNRFDETELRNVLSGLFANSLMVGHNIQFDYMFTKCYFDIKIAKVYCTMVAEQVLTAGYDYDYDLKSVIERRFNVSLDKKEQKSFIGINPETFDPTPEQLAYAAKDVQYLLPLYDLQLAVLKQKDLVRTMYLEMQVLPVFAAMSLNGMKLDLGAHKKIIDASKADTEYYQVQAAGLLDEYYQIASKRTYDADLAIYTDLKYKCDLLSYRKEDKAKLVELRKERDKHKPKPLVPLNLGSQKQVLAALAEAGVSLPDLQEKTVLENGHRHPALSALAGFTKSRKTVVTYGDSLVAMINPLTKRIHPGFRQCGADTGRTSSNNPNGQNIPPQIRNCFIPDFSNTLVIADYASMEMRIMAGLANDKAMLDAIGQGIDLHKLMASRAFPDLYPIWKDVPKDSPHRQQAKVFNFAIAYGATPEGLFKRGLLPDIATGKRLAKAFKDTFPDVYKYIQHLGDFAVANGYVMTAGDRRKHFIVPERTGSNFEYQKLLGAIRREAGNMPVQGTGADIMKQALVFIDKELPTGALIINCVHDEVVVECRVDQAEQVKRIVADCMQCAGSVFLPNVAITADVVIKESWNK